MELYTPGVNRLWGMLKLYKPKIPRANPPLTPFPLPAEPLKLEDIIGHRDLSHLDNRKLRPRMRTPGFVVQPDHGSLLFDSHKDETDVL